MNSMQIAAQIASQIPLVPEYRHAPRGYFAMVLGKNDNPHETFMRRYPKRAKGKAAVKAAKRARHRAMNKG